MVLYLCRDYVSQDITSSNRTYIHSYVLSIFLRRILGYSYVGDTNYPINSLGRLLIATGDSTPTMAPTFPVGSAAGIANNGSAIEVQIPLANKAVSSDDIGRILVIKSTKYPTRNSGLFVISALQRGNFTTIAAGSNNATLPQSTINVVSTTGFPSSGTIFIGSTTTVTSGSNNVALPTSTINVVSTTGFASSGTILINTSAGQQTVTYTGITPTTFTGCTGGTGSMFTDGTVINGNGFQIITYTGTTSTTFTGCSGGTGKLVTGQVVYNQNKYVIDYRGGGDLACPEPNDTVMWWLYDKDINCPKIGAGNGSSGYNGNGSSVTPRIILQSPHALGWQVRICNESTADNYIAHVTATPGFGGDSAGDFSVGGDHLHTLLFYNKLGSSSNRLYIPANGLGSIGAYIVQMRYYLVGDDTGQSVHLICRRLNDDQNSPYPFFVSFGLPDNEPTPLPIKNIERLFVLASTDGDNKISLAVGNSSHRVVQGMTFRYAPISCNPSVLAYVAGNNQLKGPQFDTTAGDCPFTSSTELITVDLVAGVFGTWANSSEAVMGYYPKVIGSLPILRAGRGNFGEFTLTTDAGTWTVSNASNTSPIQITTSTSHTLVTGQIVAIHSVNGNTAANGTFTVTVTSSSTFTLDGSTGNGTYTSGGKVLRGASWLHTRNGIFIPWNGTAVV